jgi:cell division protein FtsZ
MNTSPSPDLSIRFIGVGNAGVAMLNAIAARELPGATCIAVNTDEVSLAASAASERVSLESKQFRGMGTGGDPERGRELAEEQFGRLKSLCEGAQVVFVMAGMGGGVGSGVAPVLARAAKECGALVIGFAALPFEMEGARRMRQAERSHGTLREFADGVVCWPNQRVFKSIGENSTVADTLRSANERVADGICGLWRILARRGLMDVQFPELCGVLCDAHAEALFAAVEAEGENRAAVAVEKLLAHPLMEGGEALTDARAVLVGIAAGSNLTMAEVGRVMEAVNSRCGEARVFLGAAEDATLGERLVVTVVAAGAGEELEEEPEPPAPARRRVRPTGDQQGLQLNSEFLEKRSTPRPRSRFVAANPEMSRDEVEELAERR